MTQPSPTGSDEVLDPRADMAGAADGIVTEGSQAAAAPPGEPAAPGADTGSESVSAQTPEQLADRARELTADLQRLQAEFLNYKRRVDRDRELVLQNAKFSILSALLPVLDDVDRAREHDELSGGIKAIAEALERVVAGEGLMRFGASGDPFDPRLHEALMHSVSAGATATTCDKIVQAGYQFGDRVVRPALVTVIAPDPDAPAGQAAEATAAVAGQAPSEAGVPGANEVD